MDVDVPSPISPISSPSSISNVPPPISIPPNNFLVDLNIKKEELPTELVENHKDETIDISVLLNGSPKSAEASLRRTLKKCNLRSIEPKLSSNLKCAFIISIRKTTLQNTLLMILNNWISVDETKPPWFRVRIGDKLFIMQKKALISKFQNPN